MTTLIVECPRDPRLYATLDAVADDVEIAIWRRGNGLARHTSKRLAEMTVDAPLHLVADRVHDLLINLHMERKI